MNSFDPGDVECFEGEGPQALCALLAVENMPRSRQTQIFGPPACPAVHEILPQSFSGRKFINSFLTLLPLSAHSFQISYLLVSPGEQNYWKASR